MVNPSSRHIVIDGRELAGRPTGVGRFLIGLLRVWARDTTLSHRFTVIVPGDVPEEVRALGPAIAIHQVAAATTGTWFEQFALPQIIARLTPDVFFAPAYTAPLRCPCPFVVAIHDLSYFAHPSWFGWREGVRRRWITKAAARRAAGITTLSEFSAGEITRYLGVSRSRIALVPPGAPERSPVRPVPRDPIILFVGTLLARRHIKETIDAIAIIGASVPAARLVIVGDDRGNPPVDPVRLATRAGVADRVEWRRYVPDAELIELYDRARAFVFVSDYEGFAMTPMEALAHGVPVVLEDTPIAREVYGDGAALVSPTPAAIADALMPLLTDEGRHQQSVARGVARLARYDWHRSAARLLRLLEDAPAP